MWQEIGADTAWTVTDFLLADIVDAISVGNYQRGGNKGKRPEPVPRPKQLREQREKRANEMQRASRFLEKQRRKAARKGE